MGDLEAEHTLDLQATVLAEQTLIVPLDELAQLCPYAEQIIEDLLAVKTPSAETQQILGLRNEAEMRAFIERVILVGSSSPQDLLAKYLYQGKAARHAGINPRKWIFQVHRPLRVAMMKFLHYREIGQFCEEIIRTYALDSSAIRRDLEKLLGEMPTDQSAESDPLQARIGGRLSHMSQLEFLFRKGAAIRLMKERIESFHQEDSSENSSMAAAEESADITKEHSAFAQGKAQPGKPANGGRLSARIPLNAVS